MTVSCFEDLECWQAGRELNQYIWSLIDSGAFRRDFALIDQINRSAGSVMDNIAEGFASGSNKEFAKFLSYSQRSAAEVKSQMYRALDRGHINQSQFDALNGKRTEADRKVGGLIKYLKGA